MQHTTSSIQLLLPDSVQDSQLVSGVQAFAAAIQQILREQSAALQQVPASVRLRRQAEQQGCRDVSGVALMGQHSFRMDMSQGPHLTVLEVSVHTRALQVESNHHFSCCLWFSLHHALPNGHSLAL